MKSTVQNDVITFRVNRELLLKVNDYCIDNNTTKSQLIRSLLEKEIYNDKGEN